ncbi:MAG: type II toxin-antitoxin system HicA family toxin [Xenococcaceae cyanobacterium MO_188.B32]|nr:type II toxin-antitoxin system HicA family toxin [Xenococcaceae cyanobacterium MO_188.B32]
MKRRDSIEQLEEMGCVFIRHGGKHDWYQNPRTKISQPIPRHREIKKQLAKQIIKMLSDSENIN